MPEAHRSSLLGRFDSRTIRIQKLDSGLGDVGGRGIGLLVECRLLSHHHRVCARVFAQALVAGAAGAVGVFPSAAHAHVHEEHAALSSALALLARVALHGAVETPVAVTILVGLLVLRGVVTRTQGNEASVVATVSTSLVLELGWLWRWI